MPKALQALKIKEIGEALVSAGLVTLDQQADALGLCRSTTWTILQAEHKNSGLSAAVITRILASRELPPTVRARIVEYMQEKMSGRYGHNRAQLRRCAIRIAASIEGGEFASARSSTNVEPIARAAKRPLQDPARTPMWNFTAVRSSRAAKAQ